MNSRASQLASPNVEQHPAGDLRRATLFRCFTIAVSPGFFMQPSGAGMLGTGGAAAYLTLSHRSEQNRN